VVDARVSEEYSTSIFRAEEPEEEEEDLGF
jgi:hypothetical protein